ncbi:uncharacterized protein LOC126668292 [Mercurialis annua]|uniref:uncharacterized protein LOC126668292 n=1 Tax=Mercurialis annua TaxID=3986 RepID=UPI00215FC9C4|nr:uncharacterized protein LOC126668292 [Mercurialis annua]
MPHLIKKEISLNNLVGIRLNRHYPSISHLFFVDDSLGFTKLNSSTSGVITRTLQTYRKISGQIINLNKSSVCFSNNTNDCIIGSLLRNLNISLMQHGDRYLGLLAQFLESKNVTFAGLLNSLQSKLSEWKEKFLLQGGK